MKTANDILDSTPVDTENKPTYTVNEAKQAMKAYGEMLLREAAERASLKVEYQGGGFNDVEVDKQSILSLIYEMK